MKHQKIKRQISQLIDNEISETQKKDIISHLDGCQDCRMFYNQSLGMRYLIPKESPKVSPFFAQRVLAQTTSRMEKPLWSFIPQMPRSLALAFSSISIILILLLSLSTNISLNAENVKNDYSQLFVYDNQFESEKISNEEALQILILKENPQFVGE